MTLDIRAGMTPAQLAQLTPGSSITAMSQFGDVLSPPVAGRWTSFACDFACSILGWKTYAQNGNVLATATCEVKVYHSVWPPATMAEISSAAQRPKLTAQSSNSNYALTGWSISGRVGLPLLVNEVIWLELLSFSGAATALYIGTRLQRT